MARKARVAKFNKLVLPFAIAIIVIAVLALAFYLPGQRTGKFIGGSINTVQLANYDSYDFETKAKNPTTTTLSSVVVDIEVNQASNTLHSITAAGNSKFTGAKTENTDCFSVSSLEFSGSQIDISKPASGWPANDYYFCIKTAATTPTYALIKYRANEVSDSLSDSFEWVKQGVCGDGFTQTDTGETCDDTNTDAADGCSATCQKESGYSCSGTPSVCWKCGDGVVTSPIEECDSGSTMDTSSCNGAGAGVNACKYQTCGDGYVNTAASEQCDGIDLNGQTCAQVSSQYTGGSLSCSNTCTFNIAQCTPQTASCTDTDGGNNQAVAGTCTDGAGAHSDTCMAFQNQPKEYYCSGSTCTSTLSACPAGTSCVSGACASAPTDSCGDGSCSTTELNNNNCLKDCGVISTPMSALYSTYSGSAGFTSCETALQGAQSDPTKNDAAGARGAANAFCQTKGYAGTKEPACNTPGAGTYTNTYKWDTTTTPITYTSAGVSSTNEVTAIACACTTSETGLCSDNVDNDCDDSTDAGDSDCRTQTCTSDSGCSTGQFCSSSSCVTCDTSVWTCGAWSTCSGSTQTRTCTTTHTHCGITGKPAETQTCTPTATCGNNVKDGSEVCDGTALNEKDCTNYITGSTFIGGTLSCNSDCTGFVTTGCTPQTTCTPNWNCGDWSTCTSTTQTRTCTQTNCPQRAGTKTESQSCTATGTDCSYNAQTSACGGTCNNGFSCLKLKNQAACTSTCYDLTPTGCADADHDGYISCTASNDPAYSSWEKDANDNDATIGLGGGGCVPTNNGVEICDGVNNDCDRVTDEGCDSDQDGYIDSSLACSGTPVCADDAGTVKLNCNGCTTLDCDDTNQNKYPGATEVCDALDNNCDNKIDNGDIIYQGTTSPNVVGGICIETDKCGNDPTTHGPVNCTVGFGTSFAQPACVPKSTGGRLSYEYECGFTCNAGYERCGDACYKTQQGDSCVTAIWTCGGTGTVDATTNTCFTSQTYYQDTDNDGYGNPAAGRQAGTQPQGYVLDNTDCSDNNKNVNPNKPETIATNTCSDNLDNDCDKKTDESDEDCWICGNGITESVEECDDGNQYDSDTCRNDCTLNKCIYNPLKPKVRLCYSGPAGTEDIGACKMGRQSCQQNNVWSACVGEVIPTEETCDNLDNNCDGLADLVPVYDITDTQQVGAQSVCNPPTDCGLDHSETQACGVGVCMGGIQSRDCKSGRWGNWTICSTETTAITPKYESDAETKCDLLDNNCNGKTDEAFDKDSDTFVINTTACLAVYALDTIDCDDKNKNTFPGANEICDGLDNDCDSIVDNIDGSEDPSETLCACSGLDTSEIRKQKKAKEEINGVDDNCDGKLLPKEADADKDSFTPDQGDCDDKNSKVNPDTKELCSNKIDDNCDGKVNEGCAAALRNVSVFEQAFNAPSPPPAAAAEELPPFAPSESPSAVSEVTTDEPATTEEKKTNTTLIGIIVSLVAAALGGSLWFVRTRMKANVMAEAEGFGIGSPEETEMGDVKDFVSSTVSRGAPAANIKETLQQRGWSRDDINQAMESTATDLEQLGKMAQKKGLSPEQEGGLKSYINDAKSKNFSEEQIKAALISGGWDKDTVNKYL